VVSLVSVAICNTYSQTSDMTNARRGVKEHMSLSSKEGENSKGGMDNPIDRYAERDENEPLNLLKRDKQHETLEVPSFVPW
jgi:hypothetical protein